MAAVGAGSRDDGEGAGGAAVTYRANPSDLGWVDSKKRLFSTIAKWQGLYGYQQPRDVELNCPAAPRYNARFASPEDRAVSVTFSAGKHINRTITIDRFERPVDNLWALAIGLDAIRLNEERGLDDVAVQMYQALPAPRQRDPWEVLGLRSDADMDAIEAVYRAKAKRLHPDAGGSIEAFRELQEAYEAVKA